MSSTNYISNFHLFVVITFFFSFSDEFLKYPPVLPIPVPVYVPYPIPMYGYLPIPVPVPVTQPCPVPVLISTPEKTYQSIMVPKKVSLLYLLLISKRY